MRNILWETLSVALGWTLLVTISCVRSYSSGLAFVIILEVVRDGWDSVFDVGSFDTGLYYVSLITE